MVKLRPGLSWFAFRGLFGLEVILHLQSREGGVARHRGWLVGLRALSPVVSPGRNLILEARKLEHHHPHVLEAK